MTSAPAPAAPRRRITFVGVGAIGLPMARQLARAGHDVTAVDTSPQRRDAAAAEGLSPAATARAAEQSDVVVVMVATPEQLTAAVSDEDGLLARMRAGSTLVVMSTVGPEAVRALAAPARTAGVGLLDVPVTGGVAGAEQGALRLFAAGDPAVLDDRTEVLEAMGTVVRCGDEVGVGQSFKAVNQLLCSVHIAVAGEALALAESLDLDPQAVLQAVASGGAGSWMLSDRGPRMLEGPEAEVRSAVGIFVKDTNLVEEIAADAGFDAPLLRAAREKYRAAAEAGLLGHDDSQVIQTYR
ncbi:NAD(P)-dependent oxidoreductase [Nesterenkonia halophila]|uniref:NAD(P)-dependent oxidoreductase n=1 Tax=Nesterenkonia halophila TaxID=302044 RepID=UPI001292423A|nr:NAD(P)-dependent oxidoreductase [Nesterenkonia halophila]